MDTVEKLLMSLAMALSLAACSAPDNKSEASITITEPHTVPSSDPVDSSTPKFEMDDKILGRWELTHLAGFEANEPRSFTIQVSNSHRWGRRYIANIGGSFIEFKIDGDDISFGRGVYATAAGQKLDLRLRYDYVGVLEEDIMSGKASYIEEIDQYGDPVQPGSDERILPPLDQGFSIKAFEWRAIRVSKASP